MKIKLATSCFIISTLLIPALAQADDRHADRAHPKTFVKDSVITSKIKTKLAAEKIKSLVHIQVDTDSKGEVVLSGKVRTQAEADKALAIARATEGVTAVESKLVVKTDD